MAGQNLYEKNNSRFKAILLSYSRRPEKAFLVFFVAGLLALGAGVWYARNTIRKPFIIIQGDEQVVDNSEVLDDFANLLAEQQKDTDGDSLTDYQEINIYKTSIYLTDSDSDGIDDNIEIAKGSNPNCPEGQDCSFVSTPNNNLTATDILPVDKDFISPEYISSAKFILLQNGYTETDLQGMSDDQIVNLYQNILSNPDSSISQQKKFVAGEANVAQLRQLLLEGGVEANVLDKIADKDLLDAYNQIVAQQQAQ